MHWLQAKKIVTNQKYLRTTYLNNKGRKCRWKARMQCQISEERVGALKAWGYEWFKWEFGENGVWVIGCLWESFWAKWCVWVKWKIKRVKKVLVTLTFWIFCYSKMTATLIVVHLIQWTHVHFHCCKLLLRFGKSRCINSVQLDVTQLMKYFSYHFCFSKWSICFGENQ